MRSQAHMPETSKSPEVFWGCLTTLALSTSSQMPRCRDRRRKIRSGPPSETRFGAAFRDFSGKFARVRGEVFTRSFNGPRRNQQLPRLNGMLLAINLLGTQTYSDLIFDFFFFFFFDSFW